MSFKSTKQFVNFLFEASNRKKRSLSEVESSYWHDLYQDEQARIRKAKEESNPRLTYRPSEKEQREIDRGKQAWDPDSGLDPNDPEPENRSSREHAAWHTRKLKRSLGLLEFKSVNSFVNYLFEQAESEEKPKSEEDMSPKEMVAAAIDNTPPDYMERSLKQRSPGPDAAGSTFLQPETAESLKDADWKPLTQNAQAITPPAIAFQADIPGNLGAADINDYPDDLEAVIQPAHGGKGIHRGTGKLMAELAAVLPSGMPQVDFTTIILGPSKDDPSKMQVWTFHPGAPATQGIPVFLEDMKKEFGTEDDKILTTVGKAKELGFVTIKHINALPTKAKEPLQEGFLFKRSRRHREF